MTRSATATGKETVLGLDLSLTSTGVAVVSESACFARRLRTAERGPARLRFLRSEILRFIFESHATLIVVEGYALGAIHQAYEIGELGGVIRLALWENGHRVVIVPPTRLKMFATGRGNAKKPEMVESAKDLLGYPGKSHDEADALWLATLGATYLGLMEPIWLDEKRKRALIDLSLLDGTAAA